MTARDQVIAVFNDSAAMPGNEDAFESALDAYRISVIEEVAQWLDRGAPTAAKWVRQDYLGVKS